MYIYYILWVVFSVASIIMSYYTYKKMVLINNQLHEINDKVKIEYRRVAFSYDYTSTDEDSIV